MPKRVRVIAVVRDRAWALPGHLQALAEQRLDGDVQVDHHYIHYGCTDPTPAVLQRFATRVPVRITDGGPAPADGAAEMALRCSLLNAAADDAVGDGCDYALFIDPAVRLPAGGIQALIEAGRPAVGAVLCVDRCYDLPDGFRESNVYTRPAGDRFESVLGGPAGLQPCDAVTHVVLVDRSALQAGVCHQPHPNGEDFGFARSAATRKIRLHALGDVRCQFAPGPEDTYLQRDTLTTLVCGKGNVRLQVRGDRYVVTLSPRAIAHALAASLASSLPSAITGGARLVPGDFNFNWTERVAQIDFRQPPT